jgi:DNA-binding transcriptional ArsR family regulator
VNGAPVNAEVPRGRPLDAARLKALAHPFRLRLYQRLEDDGPATATELARDLGSNSGTTSYHLRELSRGGLVQDAPGERRGRERRWQATPGGWTINADDFRGDPETAPAAELVVADYVRQRVEELRGWVAESRTTSRDWIEASRSGRRRLRLTPDELAALVKALDEAIEPWAARTRDRESGVEAVPDGAARVVLAYDAFPTGVGTPGPDAP